MATLLEVQWQSWASNSGFVALRPVHYSLGLAAYSVNDIFRLNLEYHALCTPKGPISTSDIHVPLLVPLVKAAYVVLRAGLGLRHLKCLFFKSLSLSPYLGDEARIINPCNVKLSICQPEPIAYFENLL